MFEQVFGGDGHELSRFVEVDDATDARVGDHATADEARFTGCEGAVCVLTRYIDGSARHLDRVAVDDGILFGMDGFVTGPMLAVLFVTVGKIFMDEFKPPLTLDGSVPAQEGDGAGPAA